MTSQPQIDIHPAIGPYPMRPRVAIQPFDLKRPTAQELEEMKVLQAAFDTRFPPLRMDRSDVFIVSWREIERQFLDLCAPWDQQEPCYQIRRAEQMSRYESAEKTVRWLFSLSNGRTGIDAPEPKWGSGDSIPVI